ncbi:MAG: hypothetical protein QNL16_10370 [Rhodobacterales bacterium]|nr:hypothetical protein [Pseudomonadota bacterium]NQW13268.1 hypothetical protein [Rhodobacter sp.]
MQALCTSSTAAAKADFCALEPAQYVRRYYPVASRNDHGQGGVSSAYRACGLSGGAQLLGGSDR